MFHFTDEIKFDMEPFAQGDDYVIFNADSNEVLPSIEDGAFDIVLTDPPYNEVNRKTGEMSDGEKWANYEKGRADSLEVDPEYLSSEFARVSRSWVYVWCGWGQVSNFINGLRNEKMGVRLGTWEKASPVPMNASRQWLSAIEVCAIGRKPNAPFGGYAEVPTWKGERTFDAVHPTQKPTWLFRHILEVSIPQDFREGEPVVFDPFMGSGTTLEAARSIGAMSVGIDIDLKYCEIAAERMSQGMLF